MKGTRVINRFSEKKTLIDANKPFMVQEMVYPHNSGSAARIFFKILHTEKC